MRWVIYPIVLLITRNIQVKDFLKQALNKLRFSRTDGVLNFFFVHPSFQKRRKIVRGKRSRMMILADVSQTCFKYSIAIKGSSKKHLHWEPFWIWRPSDGCHLMNSPFDGFFTPSYLVLFVDCRHSSSKNWYDKGRIIWWSLIFSWQASLTM